ncbi:Sugar transporter ERD6-like 5 [Bienertia sinuspersici]
MYFLVIQYSVFGSILTIGAMIGAILSGWIEDHFGRRGAMAFSKLLCIVGCLAIVFAKVAWLLDVARLLNVDDLLWCIINLDCWNYHSLAYPHLNRDFPSILQFLGVFFILKSPRWLAKNSRWEDRKDVLKYLRGQHVDTSAEDDEIREYAETFRIYLKQIFLTYFKENTLVH